MFNIRPILSNNNLFWNSTIPICPENKTYFGYPSTAITHIIISSFSFILSLVIVFKFNFVTVFAKKIRTHNISNTAWVTFFIAECIRSSFRATAFAVALSQTNTYNDFTYAAYVCDGFCILFLSWSLSHQTRYRLSVPEKIDETKIEDGADVEDSWISKLRMLIKSIGWLELLFALLLAVYVAFLFLAINVDEMAFVYVAAGLYFFQRVPIVCFVTYILAYFGRTATDGPSSVNKGILLLGSIGYLVCDIPSEVWAKILPGNCVFFGSWVDGILFLYCISLILFFVFLVLEFKRNKEECIWQTISQIQDTFDFRKF